MDRIDVLNADEPIKTIKEDKYNRKHIAEYFSSLLINNNNQKSLVVSIEGDWGCGKTSFYNLIKEDIKIKNSKIKLVDFNPWSCKNTEIMYNCLLNIVIENYESFLKKSIKRLYNPLRYLLLIILILFLVIKPSLKNLDFINNEYVKRIIEILSFVFFTFVTFYDKIYKFLFLKNKDDNHKKTNKVRNLLNQNRLIVFIDDIDRIDGNSLNMLFSLINNVFNFNNTIFVLAYDRDYILHLLEKTNVKNPVQYLEKVIQIKLDLPKIEKEDIQNSIKELFDISLSYHLQDYNPKIIDSIKQKLIDNINGICEAFSELIITPRQISLLKNEIVLRKLILKEVNPFDFLILCFIKIMYCDQYKKLKDFAFNEVIPSINFSFTKISDNKIDLTAYYMKGNKTFNKLINLLFNEYSLEDIENLNYKNFAYKELMFNFNENESKKRYFQLKINSNDFSRMDFIKLFSEKNEDFILFIMQKYINGKDLIDVLLFFNYFNSFLNAYKSVDIKILIRIINTSFSNFCSKKDFYLYKSREDYFKSILSYETLFSDKHELDLSDTINDLRLYMMIIIYLKCYTGQGRYDDKDYSKTKEWIYNKIQKYSNCFKNSFEKEKSELNLFIAYHLQSTNITQNDNLSNYFRVFFKEIFKVEKNVLLFLAERIPELKIYPDPNIDLEIFIFKFHLQMNLFTIYENNLSDFKSTLKKIIYNYQDISVKDALNRFFIDHILKNDNEE